MANPMDAKRRAGLKKLKMKTEVFLPDVQEVITRLRSGTEGFCQQELDKINQAFLRFKDDDAPEVHKDQLPVILRHLGYAQIDLAKIREMADTITTYPVLEKSDFITFMEQHAIYEYQMYKNIFETFDADNSGSLDAAELVPFLQTLGITPLRSVVKESIEMVDTDGNGTLDFEETIILVNVYKHSEGFTMDQINELVNVYRLEHEEHLGDDVPIMHNKQVALPADKLSSLLVKYFGPSAAVMSEELQKEIKGVGRKGDGSVEPPVELNFQEALLWARKLRDKEFESYREAFHKFDADGSGAIDRQELGLAIKTLGFTLKNEAIEEMIGEAVTRGDWGTMPEGGIAAIEELDYDNFVHFMRILQETDGFTKKEMTFITATFNKFDDDQSGDIDVIELGDMLRHLGHAASMEEVRRMHAMVDLNGNGALDFREFIRFLRLYREDELIAIRDIFEDLSGGLEEPAVIKASAMEEAVNLLICKHERLEGAPPIDPNAYLTGEDVGLEEFTEIADTIREEMVANTRKAAGYSPPDVTRYRQTWDSFNTKGQESLKAGEAAQLLMQMGFELRSAQEQQMLKEQIDKACRTALEANAEGVIMGQVNFWVFLQLLRSLNRREDEDSERRLMEAAAVSRFSTQEVNEFNEVFDSCWEREQVQAEEEGGTMQSCRKTISRGGLMKLLRGMGMRLEGPQRASLDQKLQSMMPSPPEDGSAAKLFIDFPSFIRLMRWMMESDFGGIMSAAAQQGKSK